jgi:nucleoside-diphosphate-sugar epimerase
MMSKETILIFGGNGFIGAETVELLLNKYEDKYEFILVNRGNWDDWDAETRIKKFII